MVSCSGAIKSPLRLNANFQYTILVLTLQPTIQELPEDADVAAGSSLPPHPNDPPSTGQRGGMSEELAEKLMNQMKTGWVY